MKPAGTGQGREFRDVARQRAGWIEIASWVMGLSLLAFVSAALAHRWLGRDDAIDAFREAQRQYQAAPGAVVAREPAAAPASVPSGSAAAPDPAGVRAAALSDQAGTGTVGENPVVRAASTAPAGPVVLASTAASQAAPGPLNADAPVDTSLWSEARIKGYEDSLKASLAAPSALLHIPAIDLTVPVLEGVDEVSLNRGVGRIPGTAPVGGAGNLGIAGSKKAP